MDADMSRDLQADFRLCQEATPGPWDFIGDVLVGVTAGCNCPVPAPSVCGPREDAMIMTPDAPHEAHDIIPVRAECDLPAESQSWEQYVADCRFVAAAREGWPAAISRALAAEAELQRLKELNERTTCSR